MRQNEKTNRVKTQGNAPQALLCGGFCGVRVAARGVGGQARGRQLGGQGLQPPLQRLSLRRSLRSSGRRPIGSRRCSAAAVSARGSCRLCLRARLARLGGAGGLLGGRGLLLRRCRTRIGRRKSFSQRLALGGKLRQCRRQLLDDAVLVVGAGRGSGGRARRAGGSRGGWPRRARRWARRRRRRGLRRRRRRADAYARRRHARRRPPAARARRWRDRHGRGLNFRLARRGRRRLRRGRRRRRSSLGLDHQVRKVLQGVRHFAYVRVTGRRLFVVVIACCPRRRPADVPRLGGRRRLLERSWPRLGRAGRHLGEELVAGTAAVQGAAGGSSRSHALHRAPHRR